MTPGKKVIGARLREAREAPPYWSRPDLARLLRAAADPRDRPGLPHVKPLAEMIKHWEAGKAMPSPRYRVLYCRVTGQSEAELFTLDAAAPDGLLTPDEAERVSFVAARPARLDTAALGALTAVLAGQRRLEDAIGPAALLAPVTGQLDTLTTMLRNTSGPLRDDLGRIVAEWTVYAGWLYAALRQDAIALALFARAEDLADEVADGTVAAAATSFRGYVARQQGRPRAVVRAATAALATPGGHETQATFDRLQAAQGYAALGENGRARRLLDEVAARADRDVEPPPPVYWYTRPFFQLNIGVVELGIGEHTDAAALLAEGLDGIPEDQAGAEWLGEYRAALEEARRRA